MYKSCTSSCISLNLSNLNFNYFHLSDKSYLFFLSDSLISVNPSLNSERKNLILEFLESVKTLKISLRAENKEGITLSFENDIMTDIHKKILAKNKGNLKLPDTQLTFTQHRSNRIIRVITDEDKILKDVKKAVEKGRPLVRFGAYLKTFQRDIRVKEGLFFNDNKLIVPAALRSPFSSLLHETLPGQFGMKSQAENICRPHLYRYLLSWENSIQCIKADKNLKVILGTNNTEKLPILSEPNEELDLDLRVL